jgi:hypothetical protein
MKRSRGLCVLLCLSAFTVAVASFQHPSPPVRIRQLRKPLTKHRVLSSEELPLVEINVQYDTRNTLKYNPLLERYVCFENDRKSVIGYVNGDAPTKLRKRTRMLRKAQTTFFPFLKRSFFPIGVTPSYYRFVKFRVIQRFLNSIVHVLGTQSLLMGLGLKSKALGLSAALNWVLKDALGKLVRLIWASRMGGKFDSDAKRWRFRSSLVYALGNALEIVTYVNPQLFLLWATLANCCKQISMLTSSSTRTAIYNSFRTAENIADITAKGEAQIAVVDLLGIACGVVISRNIGMKAVNLVAVYLALQVTEMYCIYRMIHAVEFRVLNFERLIQIVNNFVRSQMRNEPVVMPSPAEMATKEKIFLPPAHLDRRSNAFGSLSRAKLAPDELQELIKIFENERFLLVVGKNVKHPRFTLTKALLPGENCHVVLHANATSVDIVKSTLALAILRHALAELPNSLRSRDCYPEVRKASELCDKWFPSLLKNMSLRGWAPARFMFGQVSMRAVWPLTTRVKTVRNDDNTTLMETSEF